MRLVLVGRTSFLAGYVSQAAASEGVETLWLGRSEDMSAHLRPGDRVVNFAISPGYQSGPYSEDADCDLSVARQAVRCGARVVMLSTRRVYPAEARWNAREDALATGDETHYGRNKARTEQAVRALAPDAAIFRLANIFGPEYRPGSGRGTFFGRMLRTLKEENVIRFDMHPDTRRDFLPAEVFASALVRALRADATGVLNLGSGVGTPCGLLADWLREGFGGGDLLVDVPEIRDEFYLNAEAWNGLFGSLLVAGQLRKYCFDLGQNLQCVKF
ncbi:MAG: NAD(P)-dependent oxidoreductase [Rhizomicrobium sp.]